jgi:hypothetical protein
MWGLLIESFAEAFGVTRRTRPHVFIAVTGLSLLLTAVSFAEGGPRALVAVGLLLVIGVGAAVQVLVARRALWEAARLRLDDARQRPARRGDDRDLCPTARALYLLAAAVDDARRDRFADAAHAFESIDRGRLRPEEERLLDAARALVSLGLGDPRRAAQHAARALPTTSEDMDAHLGRTLVSDAWSSSERLRSIDDEWAASGVARGVKRPLPRLRALLRLRIDASAIEGIEPWEAKELADEARAIGDEALAADLEARVRPAAYR